MVVVVVVVVDEVVVVVELLVVFLFTGDSLTFFSFSPPGEGTTTDASVEDSLTRGATLLLVFTDLIGALVEVRLATGMGLSRLVEGTFFAVVTLEMVSLIGGRLTIGSGSTTGAGGISSRIRFRTEEWTVEGTAAAAEELVVILAIPPPSINIGVPVLLVFIAWEDRERATRHRSNLKEPMLTAEMITTDDWHYDWMH